LNLSARFSGLFFVPAFRRVFLVHSISRSRLQPGFFWKTWLEAIIGSRAEACFRKGRDPPAPLLKQGAKNSLLKQANLGGHALGMTPVFHFKAMPPQNRKCEKSAKDLKSPAVSAMK
jgi:hypothetical protein